MLFTFPSRYLFTIGLWWVFSLGGWARRIHTELHVFRATQESSTLRAVFMYGVITLYDYTFQNIPLTAFLAMLKSYNPNKAGTSLVWAVPRSLATTRGITFCFLFLLVLRCFSSQGSLSCLAWVTGLQPDGLPHSEICGSKVICTYPQLIAAYHVLHRLPEPRHPPMCPFLLSPYRLIFNISSAYTFSFLFYFKLLEFALYFLSWDFLKILNLFLLQYVK